MTKVWSILDIMMQKYLSNTESYKTPNAFNQVHIVESNKLHSSGQSVWHCCSRHSNMAGVGPADG